MHRLGLIAGVLVVLDAGLMLAPVAADEERSEPVAVAVPAGPNLVQGAVVGREAIEAMLARPLFAVGRRSEPADIEGVAERPVVPRLTGIVAVASTRRALFADAAGRSVVVCEGERVGAFDVISVRAGAVVLSGPGGAYTAYLTDDPGFRDGFEAARPLIALISPWQRELETETDQ